MGCKLARGKTGNCYPPLHGFFISNSLGKRCRFDSSGDDSLLAIVWFFGKQLAKPNIPEHAFSDWISTYSSPEFEILAKQLESLVDRYADTTPEVESTYRYAMLCERDFFQAAWEISYHCSTQK